MTTSQHTITASPRHFFPLFNSYQLRKGGKNQEEKKSESSSACEMALRVTNKHKPIENERGEESENYISRMTAVILRRSKLLSDITVVIKLGNSAALVH